MTFKHVKFEDSPLMRSFEKVAKERGMFKDSLINKTASIKKESNLNPSVNLMENILNLCAGLRDRGFNKYADELETKFVNYKQAQTLYETSKETGDDLVNAAHPKGSHKLEDVAGDEAVVETILDQHMKLVNIVNKKPTGKLTNANEIIGAVKIVVGQDGGQIAGAIGTGILASNPFTVALVPFIGSLWSKTRQSSTSIDRDAKLLIKEIQSILTTDAINKRKLTKKLSDNISMLQDLRSKNNEFLSNELVSPTEDTLSKILGFETTVKDVITMCAGLKGDMSIIRNEEETGPTFVARLFVASDFEDVSDACNTLLVSLNKVTTNISEAKIKAQSVAKKEVSKEAPKEEVKLSTFETKKKSELANLGYWSNDIKTNKYDVNTQESANKQIRQLTDAINSAKTEQDLKNLEPYMAKFYNLWVRPLKVNAK